MLQDEGIAQMQKNVERGIRSQGEVDAWASGQTVKQNLKSIWVRCDDIHSGNPSDNAEVASYRHYLELSAAIPGDELWQWSSGVSFAGAGGLALIRDGELIDWVGLWKS